MKKPTFLHIKAGFYNLIYQKVYSHCEKFQNVNFRFSYIWQQLSG